jgi:hypothetical protein
MIRALFMAASLVLCGCASSPENRVSVTIRNATDAPLVVKCGSSVFGTSVVLPPGVTWSGVIDRRWVGSSGWVVVEPLRAKQE